MILVDTNVWSHHFRSADSDLADLLTARQVATHSWVLGELALGPGVDPAVVKALSRLPRVPTAADEPLTDFIRLSRLRGIGWVDAQLLFAAMTRGVRLWTRDGTLASLAERFDIGWAPSS